MNFNEDLLEIIPINPLLAKEHMNLYREGKKNLGNFLELGESFHLYTFQYHAKLLADFYRQPSDYPVFMVLYGTKLIGMFHFSPARYMGGVQMIYLMRPGFEKKGIATFALKHLTNIAFYTHKYLRVELHIDVDNIASKRVAEKAGFVTTHTYEDLPVGNIGSGNFEIYCLMNNLSSDYQRQIPKEEWMEYEDWSPGVRNFTPRRKNQQNRHFRRLTHR